MVNSISDMVINRAESALLETAGPHAVRAVKVVRQLAARQGGATVMENYQLLGKRALKATSVGVAGLVVGGMALSAFVSSRRENRRIERAVAKALAEERQREAAKHPARPESAGERPAEKSHGPASGRRAKSRFETAAKHLTRPKAASGQPAESLGEVMGELPGRTFYQRCGKRACDIVVGVAALPVVGAVTAACGAAIKAEDGGPVFYNAPRVGKGGREFTMYKLRSMKVDAPDLVMEDGSTYNGADDPRMTRVGAFMRRTSLDEIPQFVNVLKGDMSVVGPRPDLAREVELYQGDEALKLTVKPGVTGYAAVYGRNSLPWHDRLALDVEYVRNLSFPLDVRIFLKTFVTVFKQEGIFVNA